MRADRVVCDTNVLISAAIVPAGKARRVLDRVIRDGTLLISDAMLHELETRLARKKFDKYVADADREDFTQLVAAAAERIVIVGRSFGVRDPDDDKVMETAVAGQAAFLVTGDKDLLALRPAGENSALEAIEGAVVHGVAIVTPGEFLALLETGTSHA